MTSHTIEFTRGSETWSLEATSEHIRADPDAGFPNSWEELRSVEFHNAVTGHWQRFALTEEEWLKIEERINDDW